MLLWPPPGGEDRLSPLVFEDLGRTTDYGAFEDLAYLLLRLLGIHRAYQFSRRDQAGRPDGFFRFGNLAVIWDTTLQADFEESKRQQIQNYSNLLLQGTVEIGPAITEHVGTQQKQVWVITRRETRVLRTIGGVSSVVVKEVAVADLQRIYYRRLQAPITEEDVEELLRNIGQQKMG